MFFIVQEIIKSKHWDTEGTQRNQISSFSVPLWFSSLFPLAFRPSGFLVSLFPPCLCVSVVFFFLDSTPILWNLIAHILADRHHRVNRKRHFCPSLSFEMDSILTSFSLTSETCLVEHTASLFLGLDQRPERASCYGGGRPRIPLCSSFSKAWRSTMLTEKLV